MTTFEEDLIRTQDVKTYTETYVAELSRLAAKNRDAFVLEQLNQFVEKTTDGLVWHENIRLHIIELEEYKQRVREAIEKLRQDQGDDAPQEHDFVNINKLYKELDL